MAQSVLNVRKRVRMGKSGSREIRREGNVPAILYGNGKTPIPLLVNPKDLKLALSTDAGENTILDMHIQDGDKEITRLSVLREAQVDHISSKSIHFDFLELDMKTKITLKVHVRIVGRAIGVHEEKGILEEILREISIECLPGDIPNLFEIDVTELHIGDSIHVKDIETFENIEILDDPDSAVVTILAPRVEKVVTAEEEVEEEVEEGAEPSAVVEEESEEEKTESE